MTGKAEGQHTARVDMYELWGSDEKLTCASKEVAFEYVPVRKEGRLVKVPVVKSVAGADLTIVSDSEKNIYREMEETMKKEVAAER
jgi:hypothetical protein